MATSKTKKRKRETPFFLYLSTDQRRRWQRAADIRTEGNLSMFVRAAVDAFAGDVLEKDSP